MKLILTLKHWQIFLLFLAYGLTVIGLLILTELELPSIVEAFVFGWFPMTIYPLLLGLGLKRNISSGVKKEGNNFKAFLSFGCIWTIAFLVNEILRPQLAIINNSTSIQLLDIAIATTILLMLIKFIEFPSRTINSVELKREAGLWEYIADSFQILCWPLCIWWLQPRINKIAARKLNTV